jgi:hypothetical protein
VVSGDGGVDLRGKKALVLSLTNESLLVYTYADDFAWKNVSLVFMDSLETQGLAQASSAQRWEFLTLFQDTF